MKKTFRAIVAALLAAVMALGCVSAFAAEPADEIFWDYYGWEQNYSYAGTLTAGENKFTMPEDSYYCYCVFNAPESGFYSIGFTDYVFDGWIGTPEAFENGVAYNEAEYFRYRTENNFYRPVFRFEKGENIIGFDCNTAITDKTLSIAYEGDKIESVAVDGTLLLDRDIYGYGEFCEIYADAVLTFSSGNKMPLNYLEAMTKTDIKSGKNTVKALFFGEEFSVDIDVYLITDVIKSVEIHNVEEYLDAKVYYDGFNGYIPAEETITFTFSDGTEKSMIFNSEHDNSVTLPDGTKIYYYLESAEENGEVFLNVMFSGTVLKSYYCNEEKATANENFSNLASNGQRLFKKSFRLLKNSVIAVLECDDISDFFDYGAADATYYIRYSLSTFLEIFTEVFSFISFLL